MKRLLIVLFAVLIAGEIAGRYMGLNKLSLYQADETFEYIPQPNQNTLVYRHKYMTNKFSMRSLPIQKDDSCIVLVVGDSIIYGGNSIDQDSLATSRLEKILSQKLKHPVRVLNISAQSWGPDNGAAYIRKFGLFNADLVVLVYSSHDAHDNMSFDTKIGVAPYYTENSTFALQRLIEKSWPMIVNKIKGSNDTKVVKRQDNIFNTGFKFFADTTKAKQIPLELYLHSETEEIARKKYQRGAYEIIEFCERNGIPVTKGINNETADLYDDQIHFNNSGQRFLSDELYPVILKHLSAGLN